MPPRNAIDAVRIEELERQCQEYKSVAQAAHVERDKLMELMKVHQKRYTFLTAVL